MSTSEVHLVPVLKDNYAFVIQSGKKACLCDVGDATPIIEFLESKCLHLELVIITHHHWDHTDGLEEIIDKYSPKVIGPKGLKIDPYVPVQGGSYFSWEGMDFDVIACPGHTLDHVMYFHKSNKWLFSGDLIYGSGCGRIFEGTYEMMLNSLRKLKLLPPETKIFCGHEYTLTNCIFAEGLCDFAPFKVKRQHVENKRAKNQATIPLDLEIERQTNPFLLVDSEEFRSIMKVSDPDALFKIIRDRRNQL